MSGEAVHDEGDLDCGCTMRLVHVPLAATCSECRRSTRPILGEWFEFPTGAEPGEVKEIYGNCRSCDADITWRALIIR